MSSTPALARAEVLPVRAGPRLLHVSELIGLCAMAFLVFLAFGQHTFYREDGFQLVYNFLLRGNVAHDIHPLYLPVADAFTRALSFTDAGVYRLTTLFSALAAALGFFFVGLTARRAGLDRNRSLLLWILVALCPPVFFFATVVEFHAFFFLFACLAFWVVEVLMQPRSAGFGAGRATLPLLLALCTFLASLAHSTGSLLVPLFGAWVAARGELRRRWLDLCLFAVAHLLLVRLLRPPVLSGLGIAPEQVQTLGAWFQDWLRLDGALSRAGTVLLNEVLLPYLPHSLLLGAVLFVRIRIRTLVFAGCALAPYYLLCVLVLADRTTGAPILERGSYLLPLAIPAAWGLVHVVPLYRRNLWTALLVTAVFASTFQVVVHDTRPGQSYGDAIRAVLDERETVLLAGTRELPWVVVEAPAVRPFHLVEAMAQADEPALLAWLGATKTAIDGILKKGGRVLLTAHARADLQHEKFGERGDHVLQFLDASYDLVPVASDSFEAWELRSKG